MESDYISPAARIKSLIYAKQAQTLVEASPYGRFKHYVTQRGRIGVLRCVHEKTSVPKKTQFSLSFLAGELPLAHIKLEQTRIPARIIS